MNQNPFSMAKFRDVFDLKDQDKAEKVKRNAEFRKLRVHQKIQPHKRVMSRRAMMKDLEKFEETTDSKADNAMVTLQKTKKQFIDKETRDQYVSNVREVFLLEYSIVVQKAEIARLEELAKIEEQKLELSEQCLEQDAALFDEFLKENDKSSVQAVARSEQESRKRAAMMDEIRALTAQKMQMSADINRLVETIKDYRTYKAFLERMVPEPQRSAREHNRQSKRQARADKKLAAYQATLVRAPSMISMSSEVSFRRPSFVLTRRSSIRAPAANSIRSTNVQPKSPKLPALEISSSEESDEEIYFQTPHDILTILRDLEQENLRLIQHCQDSEESIELMRTEVDETKSKYHADNSILVKHHQHLSKAIERESLKARDLNLDMNDFNFAGYSTEEQNRILDDLHMFISEAYAEVIHKPDAPLSSLQMLQEIEIKLVNLLELIQTLPEDEVQEARQAKELEYRRHVKDEKKRQQRLHQEERIRKALERAKAEPKRPTGRKLMTRSKPPDIHQTDASNADELAREQEELAFLFS